MWEIMPGGDLRHGCPTSNHWERDEGIMNYCFEILNNNLSEFCTEENGDEYQSSGVYTDPFFLF